MERGSDNEEEDLIKVRLKRPRKRVSSFRLAVPLGIQKPTFLLSWPSSSRLSTTSSFFYFLTLLCCVRSSCVHPSVPYAASYANVTGGLGQDQWKIKYGCDNGFELFGEEYRECQGGKWSDQVPHCAVNVALHKPASSSSEVGEAKAGKAVDGRKTTVHEGNKCTETKSEKSPWWTVDLLQNYPVKHVRLTTRCCDDIAIKRAEVRVGNSTTPGDNQLCNWIPKALEEGITETLDCYEDLVGRYVSIVMTGVETVLSLCEVEVFSSEEISVSQCLADGGGGDAASEDGALSVFQNACYNFLTEEVSGYDEAKSSCSDGSESSSLHLVADLTETKENYVTSRMKTQVGGSAAAGLMVWVGAKRDGAGGVFGQDSWRWVTGDAVDKDVIEWGRGQPNNYNQEQNCAVLDSELDWKWNDISCRISAQVVCEGPPARCPSPPVGEGSFYSTQQEQLSDRRVGSQLSYHCPVGEMPVGEGGTERECMSNGKWGTGVDGTESTTIGCKKVDCGQVPGLVDGEIHVLDGRTTWGARVRYKCKPNYSLSEGDEDRTCAENGWTGKAPVCVYTKCPEPEPVPNSHYKQIGDRPNFQGAKLIYTCLDGHKASGSLSRECLFGGRWSGSPPRCEFLDCGNPPELAHGSYELLDGRTTFNALAEYSCNSDYQLVVSQETTSTTQRRRCESNGRWSRTVITCEIIQCPAPKAPTGGRVSGYNREIHSKIEFSCLTGHILDGNPELTCERSGQWSSRSPKCRFVDCGVLKAVKDGTAHYVNGSTHLGSIARYTCQRSFNLIGGDSERICQENGEWSGRDPSCSEIRCPLPPRPNNTIISVSSTERLHGTSVIRSKVSMQANYRVGSTLKYRCERGYILEQDGSDARVMTRRCTTSATWTGSHPVCTFVDCGKPPVVENGGYGLQNTDATYYGAVAFYKCDEHFNLDGKTDW